MRKYFPQGVLWCKKPEREHGARQPLPLTAAVFFACAAMPRNRAKRDAKIAGAPSEAVPLSSRRRTGGEWLEPATLPHHEQAIPRNRAAMHKQLSSPKRSPPPHTPLKHPAMPSFVYISHKIHAQSLSYCYVGGRLIAANSIYLINIVRLPHVGRAATKIPSRLQITNKPNVK